MNGTFQPYLGNFRFEGQRFKTSNSRLRLQRERVPSSLSWWTV